MVHLFVAEATKRNQIMVLVIMAILVPMVHFQAIAASIAVISAGHASTPISSFNFLPQGGVELCRIGSSNGSASPPSVMRWSAPGASETRPGAVSQANPLWTLSTDSTRLLLPPQRIDACLRACFCGYRRESFKTFATNNASAFISPAFPRVGERPDSGLSPFVIAGVPTKRMWFYQRRVFVNPHPALVAGNDGHALILPESSVSSQWNGSTNMSFTYDFQTFPVIANIRLLVSDTVNTPPLPIWQDDEIQAIANQFNSQNIIVGLSGYVSAVPIPQVYSYRRAAATLLRSLAGNKARMATVGLLDAKISGASAAAALRSIADDYVTSEENDGYFAVAEMVQNPFSMRERLNAMLLRQNNT